MRRQWQLTYLPAFNLPKTSAFPIRRRANITVHLKLSDKAAFDKAVDDDLKKYTPSEAQRSSVRQELVGHGLTILSNDKIGFTIRAHSTIANAESVFNTEIHRSDLFIRPAVQREIQLGNPARQSQETEHDTTKIWRTSLKRLAS
jgi:hypothetical protein